MAFSKCSDTDWRDYSCLTGASVYGHLDVVLWLIDQGCDVRQRDGYRNTVLHWACVWGWEEVVAIVVMKCRSLVNMCNDLGYSPCHVAAYCGRNSVLETLQSNGGDMTWCTGRSM